MYACSYCIVLKNYSNEFDENLTDCFLTCQKIVESEWFKPSQCIYQVLNLIRDLLLPISIGRIISKSYTYTEVDFSVQILT